MESITKKMSAREYLFFSIAEELGVTPKVIHVTPLKKGVIVEMEKYKTTLADYIELKHNPFTPELKQKILDLAEILHSHDILHGDLHPNNIVLNSEDDIRIIDFEHSHLISAIDEEIIEELKDFWLGESHPNEIWGANEEIYDAKSIMEYEKTMFEY